MKTPLKVIIACSALLATTGAQVAQAHFAVIDAANLVENIISALKDADSVLNQITQITHQVESLANEAKNLQNMPVSVSNGVLGQYTAQFGSLVGAMTNINGIAQNVSRLTTQYNATFPNTPLAQGPLSSANVNNQLTGWLNQSRSVYQGAYNTQAQVMQSLGADSSALQTLLRTSGSSQGALDVIQAGNQISGQVAVQLMKLNSQMAATNQAQMNWIAEQSQMLAQAQKNSENAMVGYTNPNTAAVNLSYDRFH